MRRKGAGEGGGDERKPGSRAPCALKDSCCRGRVAFSLPQRGPVITHIPRSPTASINPSGDPTRPHPLASLRAAPVLADAAGRRTDCIEGRGGGDLQCCITTRVYCSRIIHYKRGKKKKPMIPSGIRSVTRIQVKMEANARRGATFVRMPRVGKRGQKTRAGTAATFGNARRAAPLPLASYLYTCASAFSKKAAFCNHWQTTKRRLRSAPNPQP